LQKGTARLKFASILAAAFLAAAYSTSAADLPSPFAGNLLGSVVDSLGTPQMGASVFLYDRYERLVRKTSTASDGRFGFPSLAPSFYSIRIAVPSLLPAIRDKIAVSAGLSSVLQIRMATIASSVELKYTKPTTTMTEDWKMVLRASSATRVITRDLPVAKGRSASPEYAPKAFTDTRGIVSLSAGDAGSLLSDVSLADFGTSFALATTLYGRNQLTFSGALGQSIQSGMPTMGFRATYARTDSEGVSSMPEITATAQQVTLANHVMNDAGPAGNPALLATTVSYYDTVDFAGTVHAEYGSALESISYLNHLSRVSPFARVTTSLGKAGTLIVAYSNGGSPNELYIHQFDESDLTGTVSALASLPAFSLRNGQMQLQRTQNYEAGYSKQTGSRTYAASAFYENVNNGRINVAGDATGFDQDNILPDVSTTTAIYNLGHYNRNGFIGSVNQKINSNLDLTVAAGAMGGFVLDGSAAKTAESLQRGEHAVASVDVHATLPGIHTRIISNYEYVGDDASLPRHIFSTQRLYEQPGLNIIVRQPLPSILGLGKLELSADLRNMLAQGYLPLAAVDGRRSLLVQSPRAVRGGINFVF
jgi:hypothetical protein